MRHPFIGAAGRSCVSGHFIKEKEMSAVIPTDYPMDSDGWIDSGRFEPDAEMMRSANGFEVTVCRNGQEPRVVRAFWWPPRPPWVDPRLAPSPGALGRWWHFTDGPASGMKIEEPERVIGWKLSTPPMKIVEQPCATSYSLPTITGYIPLSGLKSTVANCVISAMLDRNSEMRSEWAKSDARASAALARIPK